MNEPTLPGILADAMENPDESVVAALFLVVLGGGGWLISGDLLGGILAVLLFGIPFALAAAICLCPVYLVLRMLDGAIRLLRQFLRGRRA